MATNLKHIIAVLIIAATTISCGDKIDTDDMRLEKPGYTKIQFNIAAVKSTKAKIAADDTNSDATINDFKVALYDTNGSYLTDIVDITHDLKNTNQYNGKFKADKVTRSGLYRLSVAANCGEDVDMRNIAGTTIKTDDVEFDNVPMYGESSPFQIEAGKGGKSYEAGTINLTKAFSKVVVNIGKSVNFLIKQANMTNWATSSGLKENLDSPNTEQFTKTTDKGTKQYVFYVAPFDNTSGESKISLTLRSLKNKDNTREFKDCIEFKTYTDGKPEGESLPICRNKIYVFNINEINETIKLSFKVREWNVNNIAGIKDKETRYLVVDENEVVMNNLDEYKIKYVTSHPCKIPQLEVIHHNTINNIATWPVVYKIENGTECNKYSNYKIYERDNDGKFKLDGKNTTQKSYFEERFRGSVKLVEENGIHYIKISNKLTKNDYTPIKYDISIQHSDDDLFSEKIIVYQYPGMYIVGDQNSAYNAEINTGYVFINGSYDDFDYKSYIKSKYYFNNEDEYFAISDNVSPNYIKEENMPSFSDPRVTRHYGGVAKYGTGRNANPNMYIVSTSTFDKGSKFKIGDPRVRRGTNFGCDTWGTAEDEEKYNATYENIQNLFGDLFVKIKNKKGEWDYDYKADEYICPQGKELREYRPTMEDESTRYLVAPKFRVASSYGLTDNLCREAARRRCATYQEDGRPAGRWRVPTYAEFEYIVQLSAEEKIPLLFNYNLNYWVAQGTAVVKTGQNNKNIRVYFWKGENELHPVRCVYDEWYWGEKTLAKEKYLIGDNPDGTTR